jgi:3-deoxy-manno-octulosonate cytidylyltransferase (CMP-KDO synthetase)
VLLFVVHPGGPARSDLPSHIRAVAIIPARYASTRFPGKLLADLAGKPLVEHVYRRTAACRALSASMVATDDERVAAAVRSFGGLVRMTSPGHQTGTDRLAEVARTLDCDLIVNVQGDEPLIDPAMIEQALRPFAADSSLVMSTLRRRFDDPSEASDPHVVKVVVDRQGFALYFSRAAIPYLRGSGVGGRGSEGNPQSLIPNPQPASAKATAWPPRSSPDAAASEGGARVDLYKHIGLYVYRRDFLLTLARLEPTPLERAEALEQLRALEHGYRIMAVETAYDAIGVDTPEDLERVRRLLTADARA